MTISTADNTPRISYTVAQGATQTAFAVPFEFFADADLNFYVDGTKKSLATHYTTSANAQNNLAHSSGTTGYIHTTTDNSITGATGGSTVVITRDIAFARTTDFPTAGAFDVDTLNTELDRITAIASDLEDLASRSVRLLDYDSEVSMELPALASRKGTVLGFNASTGVAEAGPSITAVQSLADVTTSINLLGTSAVVEDMGILATDANVTAMGHLGTSANVTAMGLLGTSAVVTDMELLGTEACVADMAILATADNVANMALLATTDIISDLNTLADSDIVEDLNLLATSTVIADMATLAGSGANPNITTLTANGDITAKTADGAILKLQTTHTTVADGDVLGGIEFSAPDESDGTDAITTSASIIAEADETFAADANRTDLVFKLGDSGAATEKMRLTNDTTNGPELILTHDKDGNTYGPQLVFDRVSASPADDDRGGQLTWKFKNDADQTTVWSYIRYRFTDVSADSEDGKWEFVSRVDGTSTDALILTGNLATFGGSLVVANGGTIGSASDTDAMTIASNGQVTFSQTLIGTDLDISGDVDIDGTLEADAMTLNGTAITTTATLATGISNTNVVKIDSSSVADDEYARFTANGLESRSTSEVLSDIGATTATAAADEATALAIALGG